MECELFYDYILNMCYCLEEEKTDVVFLIFDIFSLI